MHHRFCSNISGLTNELKDISYHQLEAFKEFSIREKVSNLTSTLIPCEVMKKIESFAGWTLSIGSLDKLFSIWWLSSLSFLLLLSLALPLRRP